MRRYADGSGVRNLKRAAATAAESASGKASAGEAASAAEAGAGGTGSGRGGEDLEDVGCHAVHGTGKEERAETYVAALRTVPVGRVFYYSVERLRPVVLYA